MTYTHRHLIAGVSWFCGLPAVGFGLLASGLLPFEHVGIAILSLLWGAGLLAVFGSWMWRDSAEQGKSRYVALTFTMGWILFPCLVVFPYLFLTRGIKQGLVSSLQWFSLMIAALIFFSAIPLVARVFY